MSGIPLVTKILPILKGQGTFNDDGVLRSRSQGFLRQRTQNRTNKNGAWIK
jgi:hypothetical protein